MNILKSRGVQLAGSILSILGTLIVLYDMFLAEEKKDIFESLGFFIFAMGLLLSSISGALNKRKEEKILKTNSMGTNKVAWFVFVFLAIVIGLYPLLYFFIDREFGLLASKDDSVLTNVFWNIGFYGHILLGGVALLIGWVQFSKKLRNANLDRHRNIGKVYVIAAVISGICGIYIGFYATGGLISSLGFISLGLVWLYTTITAYLAIRKSDLSLHQNMMIYSYAACFAAVTLRIWLPLLSLSLGDFESAYRIVAWLCWVPNIIFAFFWVRRKGLNLG